MVVTAAQAFDEGAVCARALAAARSPAARSIQAHSRCAADSASGRRIRRASSSGTPRHNSSAARNVAAAAS
ncbi:MAG TPA: hypothetical protein VEO01_11105, partial [Pseudonocardiaceae bacterium]|nr:hypothetical protein [Pseudonocardiaceae bacterium]